MAFFVARDDMEDIGGGGGNNKEVSSSSSPSRLLSMLFKGVKTGGKREALGPVSIALLRLLPTCP